MKNIIISSILLFAFSAQADLIQSFKKLNQKFKLTHSEQSFCTYDNNKLVGHNVDKKMRPASVSKLYTTFYSLKRLGPDFRFQTKFSISNNSLLIEGGFDPYFVTENIFYIIEELQKRGISRLSEIIISSHFYFNWSSDPLVISQNLMKIFNTSKWDKTTKLAYEEANRFLESKNEKVLNLSSFSVTKINFREFKIINPTFTHSSSPLYKHFKQVNIYSNNFYSDTIFDFLGGENEFNSFIQRELNKSKEDLYFYTGSGLGNNYTTCRTTMDLLEKLGETILSFNLKIEDLVSVAGVDLGTLKDRFKSPEVSNLVLAKTGTLNDTSTLAGYLGKSHHPFVIFNHGYNHINAKSSQNEFVGEIVNYFSIRDFLDYEKVNYLSIDDVYIQ